MLTPHLILVLCIHVFRVADLTHVAEVRAVDIMVGVFDGRLKINNRKSFCVGLDSGRGTVIP
jgi:hypothetical protein